MIPIFNICKYVACLLFVLLLAACATYYQKNESLMQAVYANDFAGAGKLLSDDAKWEKQKRNQLLFYLNKGTVLFMDSQYEASNVYFRKADYLVEDFNKNVGDFAVTILVNAKYTNYGGENFEQILIHYYTTLNYLAQNRTEEALVEGIDNRLKSVEGTQKNQVWTLIILLASAIATAGWKVFFSGNP